MPTALAIASVDPPSSPRAANSTRAASRISSRRSVAVLRVESAMAGIISDCLLTVKPFPKQRHPPRQTDGRAAVLRGDPGEGLGRFDVVREQPPAVTEVLPRRVELEPHALERVLAVVHERVDRAEPVE